LLVSPGLRADVTEPRVPVRVPGTFDGLGVALQAEPFLPQQVTHGMGGDLMSLGGQLGCQRPRRPRRPPQRRHRIPPAPAAPPAPGAAPGSTSAPRPPP